MQNPRFDTNTLREGRGIIQAHADGCDTAWIVTCLICFYGAEDRSGVRRKDSGDDQAEECAINPFHISSRFNRVLRISFCLPARKTSGWRDAKCRGNELVEAVPWLLSSL